MITNLQKEQQEEALRENLFTIKYCLNFEKKGSSFWKRDESGCLGYPALILMASIIDTIGSFYRNQKVDIVVDSEKVEIGKDREHFRILNHQSLFNLKLKGRTIKDFYSVYRCSLTHNNSLPFGNYLRYDETDSAPFSTDREGNIYSINLFSLFNVVEKTTERFLEHLKSGKYDDDQNWLNRRLASASKLYDPPSINLTSSKDQSGFGDQINVEPPEENDLY